MSDAAGKVPGGGDGVDGSGAIVPADGSSLYYSLLWTKPEQRARLLDRLSLLRTLSTTLDEVHDPGVAERKVHWWHEEIERLVHGTARHPRTVACADALAGLERAGALCLEVLSVAATTRYTPPASDAELAERLASDHGARLVLLAHAASGRAADLDDPALRPDALATALGLHERLARLPTLLHRGFAVFSEARYARHGLTPAALARHVRQRPPGSDESGDARPGKPAPIGRGGALGAIPVVAETPGRRALVDECVDEARALIDTALAEPNYRRAYAGRERGPVARLVALRARQLRLWSEARPDLLRERATPTPLVKLHVAWRHRRGAR